MTHTISSSDKSESSLAGAVSGFIISVILLVGVTAFSQMNFIAAHHGREYTMLSEQPFNFAQNNDLQLRILSPLIANLLFLRGPLFKYFMLFVLCVFFSAIYIFFRKKDFSLNASIITTAALAFSTLTFYQLYFPAYTDPGSFLLIILLMLFYKNRIAAPVLLSLLLFNHESNVFLFPFFFVLMSNGDYSLKNLLWTLLAFVIACIPYYLYRSFIISHVQLNFTLGYYLDPANMQWTRDHVLPNLANGIFQAFRLVWLIPIAAVLINLYEKRFYELLLILSAIIFVMLQFFVAYDISRLAGLAFPSIIIGAIRVRQFLGERKFVILMSLIFIGNFFIPAYCVGALEPIPYAPGWLNKFF